MNQASQQNRTDELTHRWAPDDLILRKVNESDASVFAKRYGGSSQCARFLESFAGAKLESLLN